MIHGVCKTECINIKSLCTRCLGAVGAQIALTIGASKANDGAALRVEVILQKRYQLSVIRLCISRGFKTGHIGQYRSCLTGSRTEALGVKVKFDM